MSAILRAGLCISRYRPGIVVRHHHDQPGAEHHEEGEQIASPLGFDDTPADRLDFEPVRGYGQCLVVHAAPPFEKGRRYQGITDQERSVPPGLPRSHFLWKPRRPGDSRRATEEPPELPRQLPPN